MIIFTFLSVWRPMMNDVDREKRLIEKCHFSNVGYVRGGFLFTSLHKATEPSRGWVCMCINFLFNRQLFRINAKEAVDGWI